MLEVASRMVSQLVHIVIHIETYQKLRIPGNKDSYSAIWDFEFNFPEFFDKHLTNSPVELSRESQRLCTEQTNYSNRKQYAREVILWGRKSGLIERVVSWEQPTSKDKSAVAK